MCFAQTLGKYPMATDKQKKMRMYEMSVTKKFVDSNFQMHEEAKIESKA